MGKGGSVFSVILLIFEQPVIKVNSVLSLFPLFFFFFNDKKDYGIKQTILITAKKKKQNNFLWWKSSNFVIGLIPGSIKVKIQRPLNMEKEHFK